MPTTKRGISLYCYPRSENKLSISNKKRGLLSRYREISSTSIAEHKLGWLYLDTGKRGPGPLPFCPMLLCKEVPASFFPPCSSWTTYLRSFDPLWHPKMAAEYPNAAWCFSSALPCDLTHFSQSFARISSISFSPGDRANFAMAMTQGDQKR